MVFEVTGSGPVNYTWFEDGRDLEGETNSKLSLSNLSMNDAGDYVPAENSVNQVVSKSASLVVEVGPSIVQQPQSSRVRKGDGFNLSILPSGTAPFEYQWFKNGVLITGANNKNYSNNAGVEAGGDYTVKVSNKIGSVVSESGTVSVESPVVIVGDLIAQNAIEGKQAVLEVQVTGSMPISYAWYYGGSKISGANGPKLEFGSVSLSDQGKYSVLFQIMREVS